MKKVLFSLTLLASLATFAEETAIDATAQWTGVLPLTTSNQSIIVSVPWIAQGYTDTPISVSNIIKTANLTVGDKVRAWDNSKKVFNVWELKEDSEGVKYWSGVTVVGTNGTSTTESASIATLARGGALILNRKDKPTGNYTIYIIGQYTASKDQIVVTMAQGTTNAPAYTLIAPPYASKEADLNDTDTCTWSGLIEGKGAVSGDLIYYGDGSENLGSYVYYKNSTKGWGSQHKTWTKAPKIKAGVGCWYVSRTEAAVTLTWKAE